MGVRLEVVVKGSYLSKMILGEEGRLLLNELEFSSLNYLS